MARTFLFISSEYETTFRARNFTETIKINTVNFRQCSRDEHISDQNRLLIVVVICLFLLEIKLKITIIFNGIKMFHRNIKQSSIWRRVFPMFLWSFQYICMGILYFYVNTNIQMINYLELITLHWFNGFELKYQEFCVAKLIVDQVNYSSSINSNENFNVPKYLIWCSVSKCIHLYSCHPRPITLPQRQKYHKVISEIQI